MSRPRSPRNGLLALTVLTLLVVAALHGLAARWHLQDAAHAGRVLRAEIAPPLMGRCPVGLDCTGTLTVQDPAVRAIHVEHRADELAIARLLAGSALAGLALAVWGAVLLRSRARTAPWAIAALTASAAMLAAGIASRSSLGLLGHVDVVSWPWAVAVAGELAVMVLAGAVLAAPALPAPARPSRPRAAAAA